jgi:prephenate dehydratase
MSEYGIVAIENSLTGSISEVYDLLRRDKLSVVGEIYMRVSLKLIGQPGTKLHEIKQVFSHPVALLESKEFLHTRLHDVDVHERSDTAESVAFIASKNDRSMAAIGSKAAAKLHGLTVLSDDIETDKHNYTRFILLSKRKKFEKPANKTSLLITAKDQAGVLHKILGVFARRQINLSKIESRPIIGKTWNYYFYLDFDAGILDKNCDGILVELGKFTEQLTVLGSYPKGVIVED